MIVEIGAATSIESVEVVITVSIFGLPKVVTVVIRANPLPTLILAGGQG